MSHHTAPSGAWKLLGSELEDGWRVIEPFNWNPGDSPWTPRDGTGGNFSVGYIVQKDGRRAFLKAIDFSRLLFSKDVLQELQFIVDSVAFERDILRICAGDRMDRVVLAIATGEVTVGPNLQDRVPYLIFELADGDVRRQLRAVNGAVRTTWFLRALHHAATGLAQLHGKNIAHQDLKPSNLLAFTRSDVFKVADVGRAIRQGAPAPHESFPIAGDPSYAPPEQLYGYLDREWNCRRFGCDLYLLGSLTTFFVLGQGTTPLIMGRLDDTHRPLILGGSWNGAYADVVPILRTAFTNVLQEFAGAAPASISARLTTAVAELCDPDPAMRGHPRARARRHGNPYDLARYVSLFNLLARQSTVGVRRAPA